MILPRADGVVTPIVLSILVLGLLAPGTAGMDQVRVETRVDEAVRRFHVSGRGVVVAVMDRGIDWRNDDFRNEDGSTRIESIFDLTDDSGAKAPGNRFLMGTLYTRQQIDAALRGGPPLATRDAVGHGTTTTGIIAGNGRGHPDRKYRGIAPEARIVSVKITSDGAPAHDGEPAEAPFFDPIRIPVAIDFIREKARELGLPCVMILNLGSQGGPTDGTSALARTIDATVGPGRQGMVFVTGPGDDGGMPNRAGGTLAPGETADLVIEKGNDVVRLDVWYAGNDRLDVSVRSPSGMTGPLASPPTQNDFVVADETDFFMTHVGSARALYGATNGKREILMDLRGPRGVYTIRLHGADVSSGRFDATLNPSNIRGPEHRENVFRTFVSPGSLWDGAAAFNNVCPGDYVVRTEWIDVDGVPRSMAGAGTPGELWKGSSTGPTFDGRLGVDVVAPGDHLFTTYAPRSHFARFRSNLIHDGNGRYGRASAVSASAPIVAGIIALLLEANPRLDAAEVKRILQHTARSDAFTGSTPNPSFGYGKVDALAAVASAAAGWPTGRARAEALSGPPRASGAAIVEAQEADGSAWTGRPSRP